MSELGRCGWSRSKHALSWTGCIVRTPQTEAEAATIQSFGLVTSTPDSASASSVSAEPQLSLKSLVETVVALMSIGLIALLSASALMRQLEGALGNGGNGASLDMMVIFGV